MIRIMIAEAPSPRWGEGWGEGAATARFGGIPHPTSPRRRSRQGFISFSRPGEGSAGAGVEDFSSYRFEDSFEVLDHFAVPETDNGVAIGFEPCCASGIGRAFDMLAAIEFDDELEFDAGKVGDVRADRELSSEFCAFDLAGAEALPEFAFHCRGVASQFAGDGRQSLFHRCHPLTQPSPQRGEGFNGERAIRLSRANAQTH